jgi:SAM-dependent MidA family methyltransferase
MKAQVEIACAFCVRKLLAPVKTELQRKIIERISRDGPITFRDFMQAALYDTELGYYNSERLKIGPQGDYYTSSNVHPDFGAVLSRLFAELWADSDEPLTIVEIGPGTGQLAYDVVSALRDEHPGIFSRLTYLLIEASPSMQQRQRERLAVFDDRVRWLEMRDLERSPVRGIVFSNEFVDALPVHRARNINGEIQELFVTTAYLDEEVSLSQVWGTPSTERFAEYFRRVGVTLIEDQIVEINLDAIDWLARIGHGLELGFLVTIDYGESAQLLYAPERRSGTLRSFYKHRLIDSPLERVGEQDITASVNFTALIEYGREFGLDLLSYERQTAFLLRMGLIDRIAGRYRADADLADLKDRLAVKNLFVPGGVSDSFRVLIQRRCQAG